MVRFLRQSKVKFRAGGIAAKIFPAVVVDVLHDNDKPVISDSVDVIKVRNAIEPRCVRVMPV